MIIEASRVDKALRILAEVSVRSRAMSLRGNIEILFATLLLLAFISSSGPANAKPRPPSPPLPEGQLASWRFNGDSAAEPAPLVSLNAETVESWSGYALDMAGTGSRLFELPEITE